MSSIRLALVGALVVTTFLLAQVAGLAAASYDQRTESAGAEAAISRATTAFDAEAKRVVADGTPRTAVDPVLAREKALEAARIPGATFFVDRGHLNSLHKRASDINALGNQLAAAETQTEVQLHQQLLDALQKLRDATTPAKNVGVDPTSFAAFADTTTNANQDLSTPVATQKVIEAVKAKTAELQNLTAKQLSALQAVGAAHDDAHSALAAAQSALALAKTIPVLKVDAAAAAIAADADRLTKAGSVTDFQGIASDLRGQSSSLHRLIDTRQATFDLLATTQSHLSRAQAAGKDVAADQASLTSLSAALNAAGDLPTISSLKDQIQAVKNDVDAKYFLAIYGSGKVILVSTTKEQLVALQDGVVVLDTLVTTGRPSLPTVLGSFTIIKKDSPYKMHSPWPPGNKYWYPDVWMTWAMEFESSGFFIHDAPWRAHYGPGSDTEHGGTHGCVNVQHDQMSWLYNWTPLGTPVVTFQGDFGG